ncbi:BMP family ABC transporter substrate-binding protein [Ureaplasma sp. ES3154-GEN]|uniref:BMP family lipoprotein n=1 Tax=Ureaplasma sp. ES3154-GEN TaxID=2984844 RepID=UPI0021E885D2|nr:BMP family ABC transporter substrate-binding protein [Ureaplasma sp. ES3154-GEN]MCV3743742.1 BMP family ABC transporter substrate-binding protein [Ureaplasma sp. ES3154-GEN]
MKKLKLNKKILFGLFGASAALLAVAAVAASCAKDDKNDTKKGGESGKTNNDKGNTQAEVSPYVLNTFYRATAGSDTAAFQATFNSLIDDGARYLITTGFSFTGPLSETMGKKEGLAKNTVVGFVDSKYNGEANKDRVASVEFRSDHGGFATGIAAAYYLNANQAAFMKTKSTLKWGGFVGQGYASTLSFIKGFQEGVKYANTLLANKQVPQANDKNVTKTWVQVGQATAGESFESGAWGPGEGKVATILSSLVSDGADLILPVAGGQTIDAVNTASTNTTRPILVIGVDVPQEDNAALNKTTNFADLNGGKSVLFSITKRVDLAAQALIDNATKTTALTAKAEDNQFRLGTHSLVGFDEKSYYNGQPLVGVSKAGQQYLIDALKLAGKSTVTDYVSAIREIQNSSQYNELATTSTYTGANQVSKEYTFNETSFLDNSSSRTSSTAFATVWNSAANKDEKAKLVKLALGDAGSRIDDQSFNQTTYEGLRAFYKANGIILPKPTGN